MSNETEAVGKLSKVSQRVEWELREYLGRAGITDIRVSAKVENEGWQVSIEFGFVDFDSQEFFLNEEFEFHVDSEGALPPAAYEFVEERVSILEKKQAVKSVLCSTEYKTAIVERFGHKDIEVIASCTGGTAVSFRFEFGDIADEQEIDIIEDLEEAFSSMIAHVSEVAS